jgi:hypothetical protein
MHELAVIKRNVFKGITEMVKEKEEDRRLKQELEQLLLYEEILRELITEISTGSQAIMLEKLQELIHSFHIAILTHKHHEEPATARAVIVDADGQIEELDRQIAEHQAEEKELDKKILSANKELMILEENVAFAEGKKAAAGCDVERADVQRMLTKVMCPLCHKVPRNCILRTCRHSMCRTCLGGRGPGAKSCPICHRRYVKADVCPVLSRQTK